MDVKDTGEVHCGRDVKDAINTARKKFNIAHSPVVADYGSINVVGLSDEEASWCFGHVTNSALKAHVKINYQLSYVFCTAFSQLFSSKSRRVRWLNFQESSVSNARESAADTQDTRIRLKVAVEKKSVRGMQRLLPGPKIDDIEELLAKAKEVLSETIDVDVENVDTASPKTPSLTSDTRWLAMADLAIHIRDRHQPLVSFLDSEMGRKKKNQSLLSLVELVKTDRWQDHVREVSAFANDIEPLLPFLRKVQNPGTKIAASWWFPEIQRVLTNSDYSANMRECLSAAWAEYKSRDRFEKLIFFDCNVILSGDYDDDDLPTGEPQCQDAEMQKWGAIFYALREPTVWNEFILYLNAEALLFQDVTDLFEFWSPRGSGGLRFPNLAPHVHGWLSTPISVTSVDGLFSSLSAMKNKRSSNLSKEKFIEKLMLRKNGKLLGLLQDKKGLLGEAVEQSESSDSDCEPLAEELEMIPVF